MKVFRRLFATLFFCCIFSVVQGQDTTFTYVSHERAYHADDSAIVHRMKTWVRSHILDDWFVEFQGGGQLYYGADDRLGDISDRITQNAEIQIGRRIFPMFGFRLGLGYGYAHGFITREHYGLLGNHGYSGECGVDENGNSLGGYYWLYDKDSNLYIQKWNYFYFGGDLFLDLAILRGTGRYNPFTHHSHILYGGVHTKFGLSEVDTVNHRTEAHIGYIYKFNITPNLGLFADLRGSFIERTFDREWVTGVESSRSGVDFIFNAQVGIIYKFHVRDNDHRDMFTSVTTKELIKTQSITYNTIVEREETYEELLIDTIIKYQMDMTPTAETQALIDSLQNILNNRMNQKKHLADDMPLDSIFFKNLLPYEMVFFELDKWDILSSEEMKIDKMARIMKAFPNEIFILTGSADSKTGTPHRNAFLSHNRADVVYDILVNRYGIPPSQLRREYLGGILDYKPFQLNRCTVIIMDHPTVRKAFEEMKQKGHAGGGVVEQ